MNTPTSPSGRKKLFRHLTYNQQKQLIGNVQELDELLKKMARTVMLLLSHPDATPEHLAQAREKALHIHYMIDNTNKQLYSIDAFNQHPLLKPLEL